MTTTTAIATARPTAATPRPIVGTDLYRSWKERSQAYSYCGSKQGQVMKLVYQGNTYEVFRVLAEDKSDLSSPVFRDGQYHLSWHVATMLLNDGFYNLDPLFEGWTSRFTPRQIHLLLVALKKLEQKVPWGAFVRQMNNFRVLNEDAEIPFSERLAQIYSPQEEWIGVY